MTVLVKAAAAGVTGSVMALLIRRSAPELGFAVSAAVAILAGLLAAQAVSGLTELLTLAEENTGLSPAVVSPVLKCVGIGVVTHMASQLCRDAQQGSVGAAVELCGVLCALYVSLPLIESLLSVVETLL